MTFVVDSSITIRLLTNADADDLLRKRFSPARVLHAPHLLDAEVASAIRGLLIGGKMDETRAEKMIRAFGDLRINRHPVTSQLPRVLALRHNLTAYDACYLTLAEKLRVPLLTLDAKFRAAAGHQATVHVYPYDAA